MYITATANTNIHANEMNDETTSTNHLINLSSSDTKCTSRKTLTPPLTWPAFVLLAFDSNKIKGDSLACFFFLIKKQSLFNEK